MRRTSLLIGALALVVPAIAATAAGATPHHTVIVKPGQSIQAAIDGAAPGDTIKVKAGTYEASLVIDKPVRLVGQHATLVPPVGATDPACYLSNPSDSAVCVIKTAGVTIEGFTVSGYPALGVVSANTDGLVVEDNTFSGLREGITVIGSRGFVVRRNTFRNGGFAMTINASPMASASITNNDIAGMSTIAVYIHQSSHGLVKRNHITDSCSGVWLIPGAGAVDDGWTVNQNTIVANHRDCTAPGASSNGVFASGASNLKVTANDIEDNGTNTSQAPDHDGGITVLSPGQAQPLSNVLVASNHAVGNQPVDLRWDGSGTNVRFNKNTCGTSQPAGLC
jgi:parallel beta-helix repeat protein